jgi:hypothetical protein
LTSRTLKVWEDLAEFPNGVETVYSTPFITVTKYSKLESVKNCQSIKITVNLFHAVITYKGTSYGFIRHSNPVDVISETETDLNRIIKRDPKHYQSENFILSEINRFHNRQQLR